MRIVVAGAETTPYAVPEYCSVAHVVVDDGPWPLTTDGAPAWSLLADCEVLWVERPVTSPALEAALTAATACEVPIYALETVPTMVPGVHVRTAPSLAVAIEDFHVGLTPPTPSAGLGRLQRYYARMSDVRRYGTSNSLEALLLLTEEVGELAHAIRKHRDMDRTRPFAAELNVAEELADVQLFLLTLANTLQTDLAAPARPAARATPEAPRRTTRCVAIEGLIGAGKTTTARQVPAALGAEPV